MNGAYYNENDEFAAAWLRNLIAKNLIAPGEVDARSIVDVRSSDLAGFTQCHFFAGIGVWSHALRCAGWEDDRAIWTGSCPCGPFSQAGKGEGFADERHLWPAFFHLIEQCEPRIVVGEQVASPVGLAWLDLVHTDMEAKDYAFAALDLCAAGIGAPHIRQRLYWMAYNPEQGRQSWWRQPIARDGLDQTRIESGRLRDAGLLVDGQRARLEGYAGDGNGAPGRPVTDRSIAEAGAARELGFSDMDRQQARRAAGEAMGQWRSVDAAGAAIALADAADRQLPQQIGRAQGRDGDGPDRPNAPADPVNGLWRDADWLFCRDGKWRPVEPGTFPLAHGVAARVGRLRGYGNAIVAPLAKEFIEAVMEVIP